jgi:HNH endonuclease
MRKIGPSKDYVFSLLSYDKETGQFTWLVQRGSIKPGRIAGSPQTSRGKTYIQIRIDKKFYKGHHLAWLFQHGEWPTFDLDHEDGDGTNNRISNLRKCTMTQNKANSKTYKNNTTGHKGVFKVWDKWRVTIQKDRKRIQVGYFNSLEAAIAAYWEASQRLFGEFARAA